MAGKSEGEPIGPAVAPAQIRAEAVCEGKLKEQAMQECGRLGFVYGPAVEQAHGKLVDFSLSFELESRNRATASSGFADIKEVAETFQGGEAVGQCGIVEQLAHGDGRHASEKLAVESKGNLELAFVLANNQLLRPVLGPGVKRDQEGRRVHTRLGPVKGFKAAIKRA
ncbi:MAG: hypothetical protein ACPG77_05645 [Nannocystaceae bacterium]